MTFITEDILKERFGLGIGSEIHLKEGDRLTPAAQALLNERRIKIIYLDDRGNVSTDERKFHPLLKKELKGKISEHVGSKTKPETHTLLNDTDLVEKTHPRIQFRGQMDSLIALAILVEGHFVHAPKLTQIKAWLADVRSVLGRIMQAEVQEEQLPEISIGDFTLDDIRKMSHDPLSFIGHNHIVPSVDQGPHVGWLNMLRAKIREVELSAISTFGPQDHGIVLMLNRMSSAVYILMIMTLMIEKNITPNFMQEGES